MSFDRAQRRYDNASPPEDRPACEGICGGRPTSTSPSTRAKMTEITATTAGRVRTLALAMTSMSPSLTT